MRKKIFIILSVLHLVSALAKTPLSQNVKVSNKTVNIVKKFESCEEEASIGELMTCAFFLNRRSQLQS